MAYRSDLDALEARLATLDREVAARTRERDDAAHLLAEARARAEMSGIAADWAAGGPLHRRRRRIRIGLAIALGTMAVTAATAAVVREANRPSKADVVLAKFSAFTDEMCQCRDRACMESVQAEMSTWAAREANEDPPVKPTEDEMKRAQEISERMTTCITRLSQTDN